MLVALFNAVKVESVPLNFTRFEKPASTLLADRVPAAKSGAILRTERTLGDMGRELRIEVRGP